VVICGKKKVPQWLWWVEDSSNGQIVAFTFGRRTNAAFQRLKKMLISAAESVMRWITDQWIAYQDYLIPEERVASKVELQSLERKHLILQTRIKRLTRKTICFSKSEIIHKTINGLFINHYFFGLNQHL
jgi:insertion element IS1 protein InsB